MTEKFEPSAESWEYFTKHRSNIRDVVQLFCGVARMQSMAGEHGPGPQFNIEDFDRAVEAKDSVKLTNIMNDAWLRAPEDRRVYDIPGFTEMCNLLDCTVDGFFSPVEEDIQS